MKILFVTDNFPPEVNAPASRTHEHCKRWVAKGASVTVITCAPNFPKGKVYDGYENRLYQTEVIDDIRVIRVWSYVSANAGFVKRIIDYTSFALMAFFVGLFKPCDVIIVTSPQFFTTFTGWALSKVKRRPWIFELRDLWPDTITTVGAIKQSKVIQLLERVELFMYRSADMIIPVTDAFKAKLIERHVDGDKIHVITNGVDTSQFPVVPKNEKLVQQYQLQGKTVIGYIGTHGMCQNLKFIVECARDLQLPNLQFIFLGDGAEKEEVIAFAQQSKVENILFLDSVPKSQVVDFISILDIALVPLQKSDVFKTVIPSKIFGLAAMQKPILLGVDGISRGIIERHKAGIYFEPENKQSFHQAVMTILGDKDLYRRMQLGCQSLAEHYDRETLADQMLEHVQALVRK